MRMQGTLVLGTLLLVVAAVPGGDDAAKAELKKLEGAWQPVAGERDGQPTDRFNRHKISISGEIFSVLDGDKTLFKGAMKLDGSKKPKAIDMTILEGEEQGKTALGIYSLEKDELKFCFNAPGEADRPSEFATKQGTKLILVVSKRGS